MKWTVGTKLGIGFGLAAAMLVSIGVVSYRCSNKLTETAGWVTHTHDVLEDLDAVAQAIADADAGERGYIITNRESFLDPYNAGSAVVQKYIADVRDMTRDNPVEQQRVDLLETLVQKHLTSLKDIIDIQKSRGADAARQSVTPVSQTETKDIRAVIAEMKDEEHSLLQVRDDEAAASVRSANYTIWGGTIAALFALSCISFMITRSIARPLREITATAERIAAGDLAVKIFTNHRRDEVGILSQTFERMTQSLREMAGIAQTIASGDLRVQVRPQSDKDLLANAFALMVENLQELTRQLADGMNTLSTSANQISTSSTQMASSATETATAVSQATTTVEEVKQTAQLASQKSKSVSETAQEVAKISQSGSKSAEGAIAGINRIHQQMGIIADSMGRLSEQSQTIGQIVSSVEELAAQSNILAVNASIEAAKAGEHGRGFSVVAQEVRSLAEQSKQATDQVRNILNDIQKATSAAVLATEQGSKAVEAGVKQATDAGQSIQTLSSTVVQGAQAATQIAASSQQQLVGVDQVAIAMESIKQASAQNVVSAKQLETAAHNLRELGQDLKKTVAKYKL
jgi:methyl-accepting chemotaxis protein